MSRIIFNPSTGNIESADNVTSPLKPLGERFFAGGNPLPEDPTKPVNPWAPKPIGPVLPNKMMAAKGGLARQPFAPENKVRLVKPTYGLSGYEKRKLSGDQTTYKPTSYDKNIAGEYRNIEGATTSRDKFGGGVKLTSTQVDAIKADLPKGINLVSSGPKHNKNWYYQFDFYPGGGFKKSKPPIRFSSVAATDANLDLILDEHERLSKKYHSKRMSDADFKEWRLQPENVELTREEVAKKLNKMGKTTMLDNKWTVSNINMTQDKLGLKFIRGEADAIKIINELSSNSKQVIKRINAIPDPKLREQTFRQEANKLISADTRAKRYGNFEPSGGPEGKLWKNFWEASVGTKTGDRIKMSGTFNGKSLRFEKNWPKDKNGYVDWQAIDSKTGQPAWKQVTFTDMTTPKGKVTFTYDNLAKQIDNTFGKGSFSRATKDYATQAELYGSKRIKDKASGKTLALGQYLARDAIIQEYKALNNGAMPDEDFIQRRIRAYSQAQVHHIEGVEINPYRVQLVSRAANFGVRDAHKKYKSGEFTKKQFIKEIQRISKAHGGIQFMVDGKIYGDKPNPIKVYKSIVKDLKVNKNRAGMIIRGIRNRLANMFQSAPLPKGVKLPIGATAAALDFMIFSGFFGMPLPEAGLGSSQWLIKNPEAAQRFGKAINALIEGNMTMREVTEQHGKDLQAIIKDLMGLQMPKSVGKDDPLLNERLKQMDDSMNWAIDIKDMIKVPPQGLREGGRVGFADGTPNDDKSDEEILEWIKNQMFEMEQGWNTGKSVPGKILDVARVDNWPYYAARMLRAGMNVAEVSAKLPFVSIDLLQKLATRPAFKIKEAEPRSSASIGMGEKYMEGVDDSWLTDQPYNKLEGTGLFTEAFQNLMPGAFSEKTGLDSLIEGMEDKMIAQGQSKWPTIAGKNIEMGLDITLPFGYVMAANKYNALKKSLAPYVAGRNVDEVIEETLTDKGMNRRDFNKLLVTSGAIGALKYLGLDKLLKGATRNPIPGPIKMIERSSTKMPVWFPKFIDKVNDKMTYHGDGMWSFTGTDDFLPGFHIERIGEDYHISGKNAYEQDFQITYEAPKWEGDADGSYYNSGEFIVEDSVPVRSGPDDVDFDGEVVEELHDVLGGTKGMEEIGTGKKVDEMTKGEIQVDWAEGRAQSAYDEARDAGEFDVE